MRACTCTSWLTAPCASCPLYPDAVETRSNDALPRLFRGPDERAEEQDEIRGYQRALEDEKSERARLEGI